jgi:hypothetical protein
MATMEGAQVESQQALAFAQQAGQAQTGMARELLCFLATNKKWWLTPIILVMLLFAALVFLSSTAAAPFLYTLF